MHWQITSATLILLLTTLIVATATWLIWRRRTALGGKALFWLMSSLFFWSLTGAMEAASVGFDQKIFWSKLSYIGIAPSAPILLIFSLVFTRQRSWITPRRMMVFWVVPILTILLAATNEYHRLIWSKIVLDTSLNLLVYKHGPAFWIYTIYAYLCIAVADFFLIKEYRHAEDYYKYQLAAIIASTIFPFIGSIIYLFGFDPIPGLDTTIVSFAATGIILTAAITQSRFLDLIPVAHRILMQHMQDGVIVIDTSNRVVESNPSAAYLLDKLALPSGEDVFTTFKQWPALVSVLAEKPKLPAEIFLAGSFARYLDIRITAITNLLSNKNDGYLVVLRDITDRRRAESAAEAKSHELERMSITDDLTGLNNRRQANKFLEYEFQFCERYGHPLSVALLDIDDFKLINDRFGHPAGDNALCSVADVLRNQTRVTDLAARMGGDEFLMVMLNTSLEIAWPVIERIRKTIQNELFTPNQTHISLSAGLTSWCKGDTTEVALERVDRLLYQAKKQGKNRSIKDS